MAERKEDYHYVACRLDFFLFPGIIFSNDLLHGGRMRHLRIGFGFLLLLFGFVGLFVPIPGITLIFVAFGLHYVSEVPRVHAFIIKRQEAIETRFPFIRTVNLFLKAQWGWIKTTLAWRKVFVGVVSTVVFTALFGTAHGSFNRRPPELMGSTEKQKHQNQVADEFALERMKTQENIQRLAEEKKLVPILPSLQYDLKAPERFWYVRPWLKAFLDKIAHKHFQIFNVPFRVTELVRDEPYQKRYAQKGVSDGSTPDRRSSHLTGSTMDISRSVMSNEERAWMREELFCYKIRFNAIEAIEEVRNQAFHIMVFPTFDPEQECKIRSLPEASTAKRVVAKKNVARGEHKHKSKKQKPH